VVVGGGGWWWVVVGGDGWWWVVVVVVVVVVVGGGGWWWWEEGEKLGDAGASWPAGFVRSRNRDRSLEMPAARRRTANLCLVIPLLAPVSHGPSPTNTVWLELPLLPLWVGYPHNDLPTTHPLEQAERVDCLLPSNSVCVGGGGVSFGE
jgi:hypothetical protein